MSAFTSNFAPQIEAMLEWADLAGTQPERYAQRDGGFREVLLLASPW